MPGTHKKLDALIGLCLLSTIPLLLFTGCGADDNASEQNKGSGVIELGSSMDEEDIRQDTKSDSAQPPDDVVIEEEEEPYVEDPDRYPMFETLRYVKQYKDCGEPVCMMDVRFGIRGGVFSRYQRGFMTSNFDLTDEHRTQLREIVNRDSQIGALLQSNADIPCDMIDPRRVDYHVELELAVYLDRDTLEYYTHDISHCSANSAEDVIDTLEQFVLDINSSYGFE